MPYREVIKTETFEDVTIVTFMDQHINQMPQVELICQELYDFVDDQDKKKVIIDFSNVESLSSQTLSVLIKVQKKADQAGCQALLCSINRNLSMMFKIAHMEKHFKICADKKAALAVFGFDSE